MDQLGDYLVRRLLGEGGMGKVYEAEERLSKRKVALKVLHPELGRSEEGRRLFMNEMQILAHLEHPNIVRSLASTEVDGELVMVLEYLDGRTLREALLKDGRFPWADAIRIVAMIAGALAAAHGREPPIIHRDLKPENIMMLTDGGVKVMDFGIAKVIQALNQTNTQSVGTLQYMSPEQIDAHTIDHRSDLYCLGLIFYELIAGRPPFQSASPRQLLNLQCTAEPPPLPDDVRAGLPKGVEQLLFQLLEKAPEDRPFLAEDVLDRLEPFQVAAPVARTSSPRSPSFGASSRVSTPNRAARSGSGSGPIVITPPRTDRADAASAPAPEPRASSVAVVAPSSPDASPPAAVPQRADTIALVARVEASRNVPTAVALGIILGLSALAGVGAYVLKSTSTAAVPSAATADAPEADLRTRRAAPRATAR